MPAHDITVYAKWDSRQYEVTFHTNQDDYEKDIEKITEIPEADTLYDGKYADKKVSEENFPKPIQPKDATEFLGWYEKNKNGRFVKANLHKQIKNNDTHLYAKWKYAYLELKYDLNLEAADNVEGTAPTDSNSYITDAKAQATDVGNVKVNGGKKVFVGWSETKDGSSGLILPSETVLMDKNKTLYAQWKEIPDLPTTKVTYDANGGVGDQYVVEEIITNDSHKVLGNGEGEKINYTREGYVFKGWNRDKNATKAEFQKDDEVTVTSLDESTNNYIYAIWAPIINYTTDGNGQVKEGENFVDNTKEEVELKSNPKGTDTKAKEGYKFSHWTADKEITLNDGTKIAAGEKITEEQLKQAAITEPLTFKANFVKDEFKVTHEFKVAEDSPIKEMPADVKTSVDAQLPEDKTAVNGTNATPGERKNPTDVEDKTNDGVWTFEGFKDQDKTTDEVDAKVNGADVKFEGEWKFTPNKHKVTHKFVSKDPKKELPEEVTKLLPEDQTGKVKGDEVKPTEPKTKEVKVKDGTWKFVSYDKDKETVEDKDVEFTGTWEFIPEVVTEFVDEDGKAIAPQENGTKDKKDIEGYEFVETKTDEKGNTKHIYKKVKPTPEVVTEYVDEDGKTIAPKENGTKDKKDIEGYEFVETKTDEQGNTKHIYKKVKPTPEVVTEYVDEDGNTISPKENGTKEKKDIDGYEFVRTETDDKGNTKHIYKKKTTPSPSVVTKFVDEKGNPLAKDEDGKQDKKDFPGYEFVETKNDKDGNVVHVYKLIPTPTVETRYVDTEGNQILADKAGTHDPSTIEGYKFVETKTDEKGNTVHIYKKLAPVPKVETRYVDENGNQLLPPKEGTQNQVNIDGYDYVSTNKDNNGNTIHVYKKKPIQDVETRYVDTEGNQILADKAGTNDPSTIEGYQLVRTEKDENGNTIHIYQKLAPAVKVETRYVDENGNQLLLPKEGTQNQVNIDGYDYVSTNKDNNGNTIHVYKKKVPTPDVVTKYVDENGNEISDTQKGKHPSKNIEGYEIITTKSDEKGNIIYVYRKKAAPTKVVTKFVDEKGNPIAESEDGKKPKKDIKGYEFVKTETDKDGNTIHIYKKKENTSKVVTKYVDENGKTIAPNEDGKKPKKDIKGYEFVKTETDKNGNTIHIYKKSSSAENKYKVTHKFESSTPGKTLPKEILDLLPKNQEGIENGRKVSPTKPSKLEVKVKDGTWVFEGYDKDSSVVNNKDVNFTGKWKFVPNKIGKVRVSTGANSRSKSNVKTGIEGSSNLIFVLIGSAFALYKNKKNKY